MASQAEVDRLYTVGGQIRGPTLLRDDGQGGPGHDPIAAGTDGMTITLVVALTQRCRGVT